MKQLEKEISEYNVRKAEAWNESREAERKSNPGLMLRERFKYRAAWAVSHECDLHDQYLEYFDMKHSLEKASTKSARETLTSKLTLIEELVVSARCSWTTTLHKHEDAHTSGLS